MRGMTHRFDFRARDVDALARVKWCRENLGARGDRWDFEGGTRITIFIRHSEDVELYDKTWRFWHVLKGDCKEKSSSV